MERKDIRVYVAGPLTGEQPGPVSYIHNLNRMTRVCLDIMKMGAAPYNPGSDLMQGLVSGELALEDYMSVSSAWLKGAHVVFRMEGVSPGADAEEAVAMDHDIPIVYDFKQLEHQIRVLAGECNV